MQIALTLLISAQTLLAMVLGNPALPQEFKDNAISIANNAIVVAQEELAKPVVVATTPTPEQTQVITTSVQPQVTTTPVQPQVTTAPVQQTTPSFGSITNNVPQIMKEIIVKNEKNEVVESVTVPAGTLSVFLNANYKEDGKSVLETVVATTDENVTRSFNKNERTCSQSVVGGPKDDCSINYLYRVTISGPHSVTFTVGDTTKTVNINVE